MKIAINGEIIDTCDIWKISEIIDGGWFAQFEISFLGERKSIIVGVSSEYVGLKTHAAKLPKLISMRTKIVNIWSENQSTIPQFNLE